jgi:hypothetical protein
MSGQLGKLLVLAGAVLVALGLLLMFGRRIPMLSKLDVELHGEHWHFYFPLGTCLLLSALLTLILWLLRR